MTLDEMLTNNSRQLQGTEYSFIDADTLKGADGKKYRFKGVQAPETTHMDYKTGQLTAGEVGGEETTNQTARLANKFGFRNMVPTGEVDDFGREVIDLQDDQGRSFTRMLASEGIAEIHPQFDKSGSLLQSQQYGEFLRTKEGRNRTEWDEARDSIAEAVNNEQQYENQFKQAQLNAGDKAQMLMAAEEAEEKGDHYSAAQFRAAANRMTGSSADFKLKSENINGESLSPLSTAWDTGITGVVEASYGVLNMLGETADIDWAKEIGEEGIYRAQSRIKDQGTIIADYKDVDGFGNAMEFLGTNMAMSLPYMAITMAGAAAAPFTGGLSLAAPAAVYSGQTWNEMEGDKNAAVAIGAGVAQAALDRLGLGFLISKGKAPKELFQAGVKELMKKMPEAEAKAVMAQATRREIAGLVGDAAKVAKDQLAKKKVAMDLMKRAGIGAVGEGTTEAMQESIAYLGATMGSDKVFDWGELQERAIAASIAGSALGGTISTAGGVVDKGAWADVAWRLGDADQRNISQAGRYAEYEKETNGYIPTIQELNVQTALAKDADNTMEERVHADTEARGARDLKDTLIDTIAAAPSMWRGATRWIFTPQMQQQSRAARILADMFGGNLQRTFSGSNFENWKHHTVSKYKNMVMMPKKFYQVMNGGKIANAQTRAKISQQMYSIMATARKDDGTFDPDLVPQDTPNRNFIIDNIKQIEALGNKLHSDQQVYNPDLGYINNYLGRYKAMNKNAIADNRVGFITALTQATGISEADATEITDKILDSSEINDIDEAFSVTKGIPKPGSHKKRTLNLSEKAELQQFMEQDIFTNIANAAKSAARYQAYEQFVGKNGSNIAKLLDQMQAEGVPPEQVNRVAAQIQDYLNAESGNYKRPSSEFGKFAQRVQKNFMLLTTFAGLGLSTISSIVEMALTMRGLTKDQIWGKQGGLATMGKELADTLWAGMKEVGNIPVGNQLDPTRSTDGARILADQGFYSWDVGAATTTGVTETNVRYQQLIENFFKWNGLQGWTNYTRAVRASLAGDFIKNHLETIENSTTNTNERQEAYEALRTIGLDPDRVIAAIQNGDEAFLEPQIREATFNFINEAVALPQSANRPLIFQDPRFALFTQFQGFIATFTANHIPKMWGEYVKRGSPAMTYNAFGVMVTMIALGFASQHLKDLLKYGGKTPHLDDPEYIRRGIFSSGLLGTGERVIDTFFPLYDQQSKTAGEWVWNETTGQSPALSNLSSLGEGAGDIIQGDVQGGVKSVLRSTPFIAPLSGIRNAISDAAGSWNFKGD